jgi:hypothetical protein
MRLGAVLRTRCDEWAGRALALAAAIRKLVVTTDPLVVKMLLRDGGDSSLLRWRFGVGRMYGETLLSGESGYAS